MLFNRGLFAKDVRVGSSPASLVYRSGVVVWRRAPFHLEFNNPMTYPFPEWSRFIDIVLIGGGASGMTGSGVAGASGRGGNPGNWLGVTVERGVDIPWSVKTATIGIGAGGGPAANSDLATPTPGGQSAVSIAGMSAIIANGGSGPRAETIQEGKPAPDFSFAGRTYFGGSGGNQAHPTGYAPGGAGAGGDGGVFGNRTRGHEGGQGRVWFTFRSI